MEPYSTIFFQTSFMKLMKMHEGISTIKNNVVKTCFTRWKGLGKYSWTYFFNKIVSETSIPP